jgi:hypothetical protein
LRGQELCACQGANAWLQQSLADNPRIVEDAQKLKKILSINPVALCKIPGQAFTENLFGYD